jgi:hypothetical protein
MTGAEHYRKAAEILREAEDARPQASRESVALLLAFAQTHATLAAAAFTAQLAGVNPDTGTVAL